MELFLQKLLVTSVLIGFFAHLVFSYSPLRYFPCVLVYCFRLHLTTFIKEFYDDDDRFQPVDDKKWYMYIFFFTTMAYFEFDYMRKGSSNVGNQTDHLYVKRENIQL